MEDLYVNIQGSYLAICFFVLVPTGYYRSEFLYSNIISHLKFGFFKWNQRPLPFEFECPMSWYWSVLDKWQDSPAQRLRLLELAVNLPSALCNRCRNIYPQVCTKLVRTLISSQAPQARNIYFASQNPQIL